MPIYEYKCACENEREVLLSLHDTQPQICECGKVMKRQMSATSFVMKQTGSQMALDTLNSGITGGRRKAWAEQNGYTGINNFKKEVW